MTGLAWVGNTADAPYPLRHRLDARGTPKCFKILGGRAEEGWPEPIADQPRFVLHELVEGPHFVALRGIRQRSNRLRFAFPA
jgi:hypothetical protein